MFYKDVGVIWHLRFRYFQGKTYLLIQFQEQLPEGLSCQEKAKLTKSDQKGQSLWNFVYPAPSEKIYEELTIRSGYSNFISWFLIEYIRRSNTWINIHPSTNFWIKWWTCITHVQHNLSSFCRVTSH